MLGVLAALGVVLLIIPGLVVDHDLAGGHITAADRLNAVNNVRTTLLQAVGGAVVLFGAYATWRQVRVSQDGLNATREGQVTDRFSRAVDHLGSDKMDVRIGGIYALWRIADHSVRDHEAVVYHGGVSSDAPALAAARAGIPGGGRVDQFGVAVGDPRCGCSDGADVSRGPAPGTTPGLAERQPD
jgi:hypothetical protein